MLCACSFVVFALCSLQKHRHLFVLFFLITKLSYISGIFASSTCVLSPCKCLPLFYYQAMLAPLARKGVTIFAIGVGASADDEELETIAYPPIRVFQAENAKALSSIKDQLVGDICRGESSFQIQVGLGPICRRRLF